MKCESYSFEIFHQTGHIHRASAPSAVYAHLLTTEGCDEWLAGKVYQWSTTATPGQTFNGRTLSEGKFSTLFTVKCDEIVLDTQEKESIFRFQQQKSA